MRVRFIIAALICASSAPALADAPKPEATRSPETAPALSLAFEGGDNVETGDAIALVLRVTVESEDEVAVPKQSFAPFEVLKKDVRIVDAGAGRRTFDFRLKLLAIEAGEHTVGPLRVQVVDRNGSIENLETGTLRVHVKSVLGNEPNAQPKPETKPVSVVEDNYTLLYVAGALLAIALVAAATLWVARTLKKRAAITPPPPPRPAWELALEALTNLRRELTPAFASARGVAWIDQLSDTLRAYLGRRFAFDGLESTTDEALARLRRTTLRGTSVGEVATILGECDLVKFANVPPDEERARNLLEIAERIVRSTMNGSPEGASASPELDEGTPVASSPAEERIP